MKPSRTKVVLGVGALLTTLISTACSSGSGNPEESNAIEFGALRSLSNTGVSTAESKGFFDAEGINYSALFSDTAPAQLQAVVSGDLDIATVTPPPAFSAIANGTCLKVLRPMLGSEFSLIARKDLNLQTGLTAPEAAGQLKGKLIGVVARGDGPEAVIRKLMTDAGLDPSKDVTFVAIGSGASAATAISTGRVDATLSNSLLESALGGIENYDVILPLIGQINNPLATYYPAVAVASCSWVESNPDLVQKFCRAVNKGYAALVEDPAAGPQALIDLQVTADPDTAEKLWTAHKEAITAVPVMDESRWKEQGQFLSSGITVPDYSKYAEPSCATA
ncbi:ABC transporter substrate-binding protein [Rhodococcus sp. NPDC055024]